MADTSIFEIDNHDIDLKNYQKVNLKACLNDTVILKFNIFNDNAPINLADFNIEFRAYLPKSTVPYSQTDNITVSGNTLTIVCDKELCAEIGQIQATLRIWNTQMLQKSNYLIILKVMSTIPSDEVIQSQATLSAINSLDWCINRYIELRLTLGDLIDKATVTITNISTAITNATIAQTNLNNTITNAQATKSDLDTSNLNAQTTKTELDTSTANANTAKSNLETTITNSNNTKNQLQTVDNIAQTTKTELQDTITTADQKLLEFKNFDTNQIVVKTNEMYNELFPVNDLLTINHNLNTNPLVQFIIAENGYGLGAYGTSYYGGVSKCNLGTYEVQYLNRDSLKIVVSNNYYSANPIVTKVNDYEYTVTFAGYTKSMTIKLLV